MFKTIVAGTDGSANANEAVRAAAWLAAASDATLHVVTAVQPMSPSDLNELTRRLPAEFHSVLWSDTVGQDRLRMARQIAEAEGADVEVHEVNDDPADAIIERIEQTNANLLVVGSRGEGMAKRALHGSVSTKLLHHAPCSILVIK